MNAKKIMGAVLVALLAAALFVGAGAAAQAEIPVSTGDTVFVYEKTNLGGATFANEDGKTIMFVNGVLTGDNIVEGIYTKVGTPSFEINVMYPDAKITANVGSATGTSILGGTVADDATVYFDVAVYNNVQAYSVVFINPEGVKTTQPADADFPSSLPGTYSFAGIDAGEWKVMVQFTDLADGTLTANTFSKTVYTFTVVDSEPAISANADSVVKGNTFIVTITGYPGASVTLTSEDENAAFIKPVAGQLGLDASDVSLAGAGITFILPDSGKKEIALYADGVDGKFTINADVNGEDVKVKITVIEGEVTAAADADFYYLGNKVTITGTNTESKNVYFYIKGSNVPFQKLMDGNTQFDASVKSDKTWEAEIDGDVFENFDAGTYTVYAVADVIAADKELSDYAYASVAVALKQPFLTAELSSSVVAQDSKLTISGTAEAAEFVKYYIFGNNKFQSSNIAVDDDGTFEKELAIDAAAFATGQYFVVVQHPMYDTFFNIGPIFINTTTGLIVSSVNEEATVGNKISADIVLNTTAAYNAGLNVGDAVPKASILFNTGERQSSNAAEALCQALDTQNIDDLYVKATFVVAQPTATINPVDDVAKGAKLVVSGTSNMAPGTLVTVEMLSTAFAAIPKESVNSASFITLTTKVQDDGTWEVTFDTTGLNVDEYTIGATVDDIKTPTVVVKVLESAPVTPEQPDTPVTPEQPEQPEQPTEPETPGFGALAALAGLGAVAVLLLRRE